MVTSIDVESIGTSMQMFLKSHNFQHKYTYKQYYYKTSFPVVLAYAMISHKSQGVTILTKVVLLFEMHMHPDYLISCYLEPQISKM